jgi:hypothetical protein
MSNTELEQRCNALRVDLKAWEKKFAATHHGCKAGRDDIKADAAICTHARRRILINYADEHSTKVQGVQQASRCSFRESSAADTVQTILEPQSFP